MCWFLFYKTKNESYVPEPEEAYDNNMYIEPLTPTGFTTLIKHFVSLIGIYA